MKIKGVKRGTTIELFQEIDIPDGSEVTIDVDAIQFISEPERLRKLNELFGLWRNQPELDNTFAEIDRDRHAYQGRKIDSLDD
ncbi:MAG TPA: hypothetical protein DCP31_40025 [Cyanobacteria bacterium UBA8543]|nr:hypothetical protein [Cyanobacteria bacterium UBA8543]